MSFLSNTMTKALVGLGTAAIVALAQVVSASSHAFLNYSSPKAGQTVQLTYDSYTGPLEMSHPVYAHVGINGWTEVYDAEMTNIFVGTHTLDIPLPLHTTQLDVVFTNGVSIWDNNGGIDWHFPVTPSRATIDPAFPTVGQNATVTYNPAGGPISGSGSYYLHYGFDGWNNVASAPLTNQSGVWSVTIPMPSNAAQFDFVFNNGQGGWDNNGGNDWHVAVGAGSGGPQEVTLSPSHFGSIYHYSAYGQNSYTRDGNVEWSTFTHRDDENAFLRFDVSQLPDNADIQSVKLRYQAELPNSPYGSITTKIHTFGTLDPAAASDADVHNAYLGATTLMSAMHNLEFPIVATSERTSEFNAAISGDLEATLNSGQNVWALGFGVLQSSGKLVLNNPELIVTYVENGTPGFESNYDFMSVAGTFNGWNPAATNMELVGDHLWMGEFNFGQENNVLLKFTANGSWTLNWGDDYQGQTYPSFSGYADSYGANITVNATQGVTYYISFDEELETYSISR